MTRSVRLAGSLAAGLEDARENGTPDTDGRPQSDAVVLAVRVLVVRSLKSRESPRGQNTPRKCSTNTMTSGFCVIDVTREAGVRWSPNFVSKLRADALVPLGACTRVCARVCDAFVRACACMCGRVPDTDLVGTRACVILTTRVCVRVWSVVTAFSGG